MKNISDNLKKDKESGKTAYAGISCLYEKWCTGDPFYEKTKQFYMNYLPQREGPFLELGVGTGRIARLLVHHYAVEIIGVDICSEMLDICVTEYCRQKKSGCPGTLCLEKADMTKLHYFEQFGTVYLPFRTVGHILKEKDLDAMFQGVYRALKHGGGFILDHYMFDRMWAEAHQDVDILMYSDDRVRIEDHYLYNFEKEYMDCTIKVNGTVADQFCFRWYSKECIGSAAQKAGFILESLMGEFDGSVWNEESGNQIWVWRK